MVPITARLEGRDLGERRRRHPRRCWRRSRCRSATRGSSAGQYESQQASFRSLLLVLAIAVLLVFGVLVAQFRRFTPALVILSAAPLSLVGAFGLLLVTGTPLNVSSFDGPHPARRPHRQERHHPGGLRGRSSRRDEPSIASRRSCEAGAIRLRPILMTTLCTLFGLLPLALGLGAGRRDAEAARDRRDRRAVGLDGHHAGLRADGPVHPQRGPPLPRRRRVASPRRRLPSRRPPLL